MPPNSPCPGLELLEELVAGTLARVPVERLRDHVAGCAACRDRLAAIEATRADETGSYGPSATGMEPTFATEWCPPAPDDEPDLSFLGPPRRPGAIGHLGGYDVLGQLGRGAMGLVFRAFDDRLRRVVAVKVLSPRLAADADARRRFLREARAAAAINHPNVVTIHAVEDGGPLPFLVMECIPGRSLRDRIRAGPSLGPVEVARIGAQVAAGLAAAHEQGVIHRDVKPANIMLEDGVARAKLTDFGLARALLGGEEGSEVSSAGRVVGTPAYMSPEQVRGEPVDARSDLFGLGCALYAMLLGGSPFRGAHTLEVVRKVCDHNPPAPHEVDGRIPRPLSRLVMRLLEKDPARRPASAAAVAADLRAFVAEAHGLDTDPSLPAPARPRRPRRPVALFGLGLATLVLLGAFVVAPWRRPPPPEGTQPPTDAPRAWTVAQAGPADFRRIADALTAARPGDTIRLADAAVYRERVRLDAPGRQRGLTIEAVAGATLAGPDGADAVVAIDEVPGVVLRGLRIESGERQFAVHLVGALAGVRLEGLRCTKPAASSWAHVYLNRGASGTADEPLVVRDGAFEAGELGVILEGDSADSVRHVRVEGNRFAGVAQPVQLLQAVEDVRVTGNVMLGATAAIQLNLPDDRSARLLVANNSVVGAARWLNPADSSPGQEGVRVANNAVIGGAGLDMPGLERLEGSWRLDHNLVVDEAAVRSTDPAQPDFLRPTAASPLADGAGGELPGYVGAVAP